MKRFYLILAVFTFVFSGCKSSTETNSSNESPYVQGGKYDQQLSKELKDFRKQEEAEQKIKEAHMTDIEYAETDFDFGKVKVGSVNKHYFVFKNTGKRPLVIQDAEASCGCTKPIKPSKPIPPGAKDSILVEFSPYAGMQGHVEKLVKVYTNTYVEMAHLTISADVEP